MDNPPTALAAGVVAAELTHSVSHQGLPSEVMTFVLHWSRDGGSPTPALVDRLASGLTRLRDDPVGTWSRGPLTVLAFEHSHGLTISESPAGFIAILVGRLDDFANIVAQLGDSDAIGAKPTDAEVLSAAYERWGDRCFEHLLGDFAAVIWEPNRRSLLCARDVVGIAPLHYWSSAREVVVASHVGGVVSHPRVRREPNEGYVAEVLADDIHSRHETLYQGVWRLVAGHAARFEENGSPRIWKWGGLDPLEMSHHLREEEYDEHYRTVLTQAITDRLRGQVKAGVEVSGGLDSSSVAVFAAPLAKQLYAEPLRSYSLTFPDMPCDETPYIQSVVAKAGLTATLVPLPPLNPTHLDRDVEATGDLPTSPNGPAWADLYGAAVADGLGALLSGEGGDQWFDIDTRYPADLMRKGAMFQAWKTSNTLSTDRSGIRSAYHWALRPALGELARRSHLRPSRQVLPPWITDSLARRAGLVDRLQNVSPMRTAQKRRAQIVESGWEASAHEGQTQAAARGGIATRYPFYDVRVIEFALGLDEGHRWGDGTTRAIQRRSMLEYLPGAVRTRDAKAEFSALFVDELHLVGGRSRFANLTIGTDRQWVEGHLLLRCYDEFEEDVRRGRVPRHLWTLWLALSVDCWYRALT